MGRGASEQGGRIRRGGAAEEIGRPEAGLAQGEAARAVEGIPSLTESGQVAREVDLQALAGLDGRQLQAFARRIHFGR